MDRWTETRSPGRSSEHFGLEMTTVTRIVQPLRSQRQVAELRVYMRAPGTVVRCPACRSVVLVLVKIRDALWVDDSNFKLAPSSIQDSE